MLPTLRCQPPLECLQAFAVWESGGVSEEAEGLGPLQSTVLLTLVAGSGLGNQDAALDLGNKVPGYRLELPLAWP